ncbi:hypothetical protein Clacol_006873 [Clathrus columnatus]|uniref:Uncharacterized protein n=1 Tax=Clathrus columnatus TaxID=1419009 RepID=A0AAV5AEB3_9AGAM|nr:hypothetical protein Clacol_006873 [Clathrus columnatus]
MGRLENLTPFRSKTHNKSTKTRSSINEDVLRKALAGPSEGHRISFPSGFKSTQSVYAVQENANVPSTSSKIIHKNKNEDSLTVLKDTLNELDASPQSTKSDDTKSDSGDEDWLNGLHFFARYNDSDSATEEERVAALLEGLQVSFQKNSLQLKQGLCDSLLKTLNDIRQTHISIDRGPDVNRGKGIVIFSSACDKRHTDAQRLQAELEDNLPEKQAEMKQIFGQIKQCYVARKQLWTDFEAKIEEIRNKQTQILERIDRETSEVMANFDKKYAHILKGDSSKSKKKLLQEVLDKL